MNRLSRQEFGLASDGEVAPKGNDRQRGIDRTIGVLELLLQQRQPMSPGDIAKALNAPRSTIYEIVNRLTEAQMLEQTGRAGHFFFGRAMHLFGAAYLRGDAGMRRIGQALDDLSAATGATVQCCARRGNKYVVLDCRDGAGAFRITSEIGAEVPLPWTASGRVLLGHLSDEAIRRLIPQDDFRLPDGSRLGLDRFLQDIARARADGFAETTGLASSYTWCQAVPILDRNGLADMTLCFVLPVDSEPGQKARCLSLLLKKAQALSHAGVA